ncbi:MAG: hypothetical protein GY941_06120 [Planctomycetes bacterium]|nr:hypothetical protein [Planctomycetota bacterium]
MKLTTGIMFHNVCLVQIWQKIIKHIAVNVGHTGKMLMKDCSIMTWKPKTPEGLASVRYNHARWSEFYADLLKEQQDNNILMVDSIFKISNDRHRLEPGEAILISLAKREEF